MTNCKAGDLAIITKDVGSCVGNIGKLVKVSGPAVRNAIGQITWLIRPANGEPYMINDASGEFVRMMRANDWNIEHPDEWMKPMRQGSEEEATNGVEQCHHAALAES